MKRLEISYRDDWREPGKRKMDLGVQGPVPCPVKLPGQQGQSAPARKMRQELHIPSKNSKGKEVGRDFKNTPKHPFRR